MYGIDGRHELPEEILGHLDGYRGSRPVRVGNAAAEQLQLDIYGELMDSVYLYDKYGTPIAYDFWCHLRKLLDWVADNWERARRWHLGGARRTAAVRLLQGAVLGGAGPRDPPGDRSGVCRWTAPAWLAERDRIYEAIMTRGWDAERQTFVQHFGTDAVDASNLIMPLVFFLSPTDPRMCGTLDRTMAELVSDSLVYRYEIGRGRRRRADRRARGRSTCVRSGWWRRWPGRAAPEEARFIFEKMLTYANHLGLYAEETGPSRRGAGQLPAGIHAHGIERPRCRCSTTMTPASAPRRWGTSRARGAPAAELKSLSVHR